MLRINDLQTELMVDLYLLLVNWRLPNEAVRYFELVCEYILLSRIAEQALPIRQGMVLIQAHLDVHEPSAISNVRVRRNTHAMVYKQPLGDNVFRDVLWSDLHLENVAEHAHQLVGYEGQRVCIKHVIGREVLTVLLYNQLSDLEPEELLSFLNIAALFAMFEHRYHLFDKLYGLLRWLFQLAHAIHQLCPHHEVAALFGEEYLREYGGSFLFGSDYAALFLSLQLHLRVKLDHTESKELVRILFLVA